MSNSKSNSIHAQAPSKFQLAAKRALDVLLCLILAPVLLPLFLLIGILVKLDGGPVFYLSPRAGKNRRVIQVYKFRSMIVNADHYLDDAGRPTRPRVTLVGKWLRRFSLDELPQVINVLKGEMSWVGPRPILPVDAEKIEQKYLPRFEVLPGLTGLAQVNGRNQLPWSKRFEMDTDYVQTLSVLNDFKIVLKTFGTVLSGAGMAMDRNPDQARK
jgi:lipopolysaccharide/colanic/teichoic acid biosynthesis glycosyltransferase